MSKTAAGLFEHPGAAEQVVHDLDASALPRNEIRVLGEPRDMSTTEVMGIPRTEGVLVFATGSNEEVDTAAEIMNRHDALEVEKLIGSEPATSGLVVESLTRIDQSGGARMFTW